MLIDMTELRKFRVAKGLTQAELAERAGTSQPQIKRLESGERKMTRQWAERLSKHLDVDAHELIFGNSAGAAKIGPISGHPFPFETPNATIGARVTTAGQKIPVYGQAVGGIDGEFVMNGNILFEVLAPPNISPASGAYAVTVSGDSMAPRYEDGEICFVDPKRRPRRGDYVVVQLQLDENGPLLAYIKRFLRHNSEELVLEQFNPPKELRFDANSVHSVHVIVMAGFS